LDILAMDNTDFAKLVRRQFSQEMADRLPQFEPQGGKGKISLSGWRSFLWTVADDLHFFIGLGVEATGASFTVEGAWNAPPDYPAGLSPTLLLNMREEDFGLAQIALRFAQHDEAGVATEMSWWHKNNVTEETLHALVADAVERIQREFLPAFANRAAKKGIRLAR